MCISIHTDNATPSISIIVFWSQICALIGCVCGLLEIKMETIIGMNRGISIVCCLGCVISSLIAPLLIVRVYKIQLNKVKSLNNLYCILGIMMLGCLSYLTKYASSLGEIISEDCIEIINYMPTELVTSNLHIAKHLYNGSIVQNSDPELLECDKSLKRYIWEDDLNITNGMYSCINNAGCNTLKTRSLSSINLFLYSNWLEAFLLFLIYFETRYTISRNAIKNTYGREFSTFLKSASFMLVLLIMLGFYGFGYIAYQLDYSYANKIYQEPASLAAVMDPFKFNTESQLSDLGPYKICDQENFGIKNTSDSYHISIACAGASLSYLGSSEPSTKLNVSEHSIDYYTNYAGLTNICKLNMIASSFNYGIIKLTIEKVISESESDQVYQQNLTHSIEAYFKYIVGSVIDSNYSHLHDYSIGILDSDGLLISKVIDHSSNEGAFEFNVFYYQQMSGIIEISKDGYNSALKIIAFKKEMSSLENKVRDIGAFLLESRMDQNGALSIFIYSAPKKIE